MNESKVFYTRTYADGTEQRFSVEDYEKNVLPTLGEGGKFHLGGDMSKHLAPNGKPSNLTHEQWHLVRTPKFKAWFGDWEEAYHTGDYEGVSKVIDENGDPLVCYHGTRNKFYIFDRNRGGQSSTTAKVGFWFTSSKYFAENFALNAYWGKEEALIYSTFLNIQNPKIFTTENDDSIIYGDAYEKFKTDLYKIEGKSASDANLAGIGKALKNTEGTIDKYRELLKKEQFDGIFLNKTRYDRRMAGGINDQIVALYPEQIKLADGSNTTFDGSNPDIRYAKGGVFPSLITSYSQLGW